MAKHKQIRVADLPETPAYRVFLYCPRCGEHYSATRGDYFMADPNTVMRCDNGHRSTALQLVREHTILEAVR